MPTFLTEYFVGRDNYTGKVEAETWDEAELIAAARTPPEHVIGEQVASIPVGDMFRLTDDGCCPGCGFRIVRDDHDGGAQA